MPIVRVFLIGEGLISDPAQSSSTGRGVSSSGDRASRDEIRQLAEVLKDSRYFSYARRRQCPNAARNARSKRSAEH